ncbi:protein kinase [bacterium]|nr:protein kinase [bacterium]
MVAVVVIITLLIIIGFGIGGFFIWRSSQVNPVGRIDEDLDVSPDVPHLLVLFNHDGRTRRVRVRPGQEIRLGRSPENTIVIDNHLVSRNHARIHYEQDRLLVEDLGSANGTFRRGRLIPGKAELMPNDPDGIEIGSAQIRFIHPQYQATALSSVSVATPGASHSDTSNLSKQVFGQFVIVRVLGEGGMSRVLLAQDTGNNQKLVAIKLLNQTDEFLVEKFRQEGGLKLNHSHIMQVLDLGEHAGSLYIVMEYVHGVPLNKLMDDNRPMPLDAALAVTGQLLSALGYAHQHGVIHRDIKPSNLMVSVDQGVKVIDFGIAKVLSNTIRTRDGLLLGTPAYMSFEQACARPVNKTSDLYSTGVMLYQMLTTKVPFSDENPMEVIRQHIQTAPMPPRQLNPSIPAHIEAAILRVMEKDASQRFQSAAEFADALGCSTVPYLPRNFTALAERMVIPIHNERRNAADLPTRAPGYLTNDAPTAPQRYIEISSGSRQGRRVEITPGRSIGRGDIDQSDGTISREHFQIEYNNGSVILRNLSNFGTLVNATRLAHGEHCMLKPDATIYVGQTLLTYREQ